MEGTILDHQDDWTDKRHPKEITKRKGVQHLHKSVKTHQRITRGLQPMTPSTRNKKPQRQNPRIDAENVEITNPQIYTTIQAHQWKSRRNPHQRNRAKGNPSLEPPGATMCFEIMRTIGVQLKTHFQVTKMTKMTTAMNQIHRERSADIQEHIPKLPLQLIPMTIKRRESKKREHVSTSSTEDERIRKKDRHESTKSQTRMPKRGHESMSSTNEGRTFKKDRTDDPTQEITPEEEEPEEEEPPSPPETCQGPTKRGRARTPDHLKESHHPDWFNKKTWTQFRQQPRGKHRLSGDLGRSVTEDEPIMYRTRARRDLCDTTETPRLNNSSEL